MSSVKWLGTEDHSIFRTFEASILSPKTDASGKGGSGRNFLYSSSRMHAGVTVVIYGPLTLRQTMAPHVQC